jgi:hypothetical protein
MNVDVGVRRRCSCSPEQVFAVLRDSWTYPVWVVGASRMRDVDDGWPAPGTKLHHSFGIRSSSTTPQRSWRSSPASAGFWKLEAGQFARLGWRSPSTQTPAAPWSRSPKMSPTALLSWFPSRYGWPGPTYSTARRCAARLPGRTPHVSSHPRLATRSSFDSATGHRHRVGSGPAIVSSPGAGSFKRLSL